MDPSTAIAVNQVAKIFGSDQRQVVALDYVSVDIRENEFFTLLGPSGCGKTTLLRLIAGFEHPSSGSIALHGEDITHLPPFQRPVNTVFQSYALFPHMTVAENIGFGLEMQDKPTSEIKNTVEKMLDLVQMTELADRRTDQISGGQQQRVALARALAPHPKVLLLDEPLSALDYKLRKEMQIELKRLQNETGITFVFVTHDQEEALTMSDRVAVMNQGKILQTGSPKDIYNHPTERFVADFIGDTNFIAVEILPGDESVRNIKLPSGRLLSHTIPQELGNGPATIAIRPEQATLQVASEDSDVEGILDNIVYSGNDTHFHIKLTSGEPFVVRVQSRGPQDLPMQMGQRVGIVFDPDSTQLLRD